MEEKHFVGLFWLPGAGGEVQCTQALIYEAADAPDNGLINMHHHMWQLNYELGPMQIGSHDKYTEIIAQLNRETRDWA